MKKFTLSKRFLLLFGKWNNSHPLISPDPSLAKGMTLTELIVGMMVAGVIVQLAYFGFAINRGIYLTDAVKNEADQNIRTLFEVIGPSIQQAGQGLSDPSFPVIIINPEPLSPANSVITIRQIVAVITQPICANVTAGSQTQVVIFDNSTAYGGCMDIDNDNTGVPDQIESDLEEWKNYRAKNGGTLRVYIYNGAGQGQFFNYTGERLYNSSGGIVTAPSASSTSTQVAKVALLTNSSFSSAYNAGGSAQILLIQEQKYRLGYSSVAANNKPNTLQVSINDETPVDIINKIGQFRISTTIQQNVTPTTTQKFECATIPPPLTGNNCSSPPLPSSYAWSQIYTINVTAKPQALPTDTPGYSANLASRVNEMAQTRKFFPRNILNY